MTRLRTLSFLMTLPLAGCSLHHTTSLEDDASHGTVEVHVDEYDDAPEEVYTLNDELAGADDFDNDVVEVEVHHHHPKPHSYSGYTSCGHFLAGLGSGNKCQPGSYCRDASFSKCSFGCLSNQNCSPEQVCIKRNDQQLGSCQNATQGL